MRYILPLVCSFHSLLIIDCTPKTWVNLKTETWLSSRGSPKALVSAGVAWQISSPNCSLSQGFNLSQHPLPPAQENLPIGKPRQCWDIDGKLEVQGQSRGSFQKEMCSVCDLSKQITPEMSTNIPSRIKILVVLVVLVVATDNMIRAWIICQALC